MRILKSIVKPFVTWSRKRRFLRLIRQSPRKIIVGASSLFQPGWILTEIEFFNLLIPEMWSKYFEPDSIDALLAEHVWEHLTLPEGLFAAKTSFKYLKKGGHLRVAVPDGFHPSQGYLEEVKPNGRGAGALDHKVLFTYKTITDVFESAGFKVKLLEYFDEQGRFHYQEWQPEDGMVRRSKNYDPRNRRGHLNYTSIIIDAIK